MGRAVIYTRVSTDKQEADGDSLDVQKRDCEADCDKHGDTVVGVTSDTYSGHDSLDERPGMWQAIRMIQRGEADTLVIKRANRAARSIEDLLIINRHVREAGGRLRFVVEGEMPNTPMGKIMLGLHGFQAETDWEIIRQNTQQGIHSRVERGRPLVSVPLFGYHYVSGDRHQDKYTAKMALVPDDESMPIVQRIFEKADEGWGCRHIARWLNEQGYMTPSQLLDKRGELGKRHLATAWSARMVYDILTKESYSGKHTVFREHFTTIKRDGRNVRVHRTKSTDGVVALSIPPLVDVAVFERVNARLTGRSLEWDRQAVDDEPLLNKGFAICGVCGARMVAARHFTGGYRLYVCGMRTGVAADVSRTCKGGSFAVRASEVDQDIWERVKAIIRDGDKFRRLTQSKTVKLEQERQEAVERAETVARELAEMREKQATVYERMVSEKNDTIYAMHRAELERLTETVAALEKRVKAAQSNVESAQVKQDAHKLLLAGVASVMKRHETDQAYQELTKAYLVEQGADPSKHHLLLPMVRDAIDEVTLDKFTREEKRDIMRDLDVQVPMYPQRSEWARTHDHRWGFRFTGDVLSGVSS